MASPVNWNSIEMVVFDVDGTLYRQSGMRRLMARDLLLYTLRSLNPRSLRILQFYRRRREELGAQGVTGFETQTLAEAAEKFQCRVEAIQAVVSEWIDTRPLPYLERLRYPGVIELFAGLRRHGKTVGILSDFPAAAKIAALGLEVDIIASAVDPDIEQSKPTPKGLQVLMEKANTPAERCIVIGDRWDRDGLAAQAAGTKCLIRTKDPLPDWQCFASFDDPIFAEMI